MGRLDGQKGYLTIAEHEHEQGAVGEVTIGMAKQGSTLAGMMDAVGIAVSLGLQAGASLDVYVSEFSNMRFVPAGHIDDPELPVALSIMDYVAWRLAVDSLALDDRVAIGIRTSSERSSSIANDGWVGLPGLAMSMPNESSRPS